MLLVTDESYERHGIYEFGVRLQEFARAITVIKIATEPDGEIEWAVLDSAVLVEGHCIVA